MALKLMDDAHTLSAMRLEGYLQAVSALKDDGTSFQVLYLGQVPPERSTEAFCNAWKLPAECLRLMSPGDVTLSGIPVSLKQWIMSRRWIVNSGDSSEIDERLFDGFKDEIGDILPRPHCWQQLTRVLDSPPIFKLGAIWDVFILGVSEGTYAIHCSWDS